MKAIWKYPFEVVDIISLMLPKDAIILSVQTQKGIPCIWALVETTAETDAVHFYCYGTGHEHESIDGDFIGTFQLMEGDFVGHLFKEKKR